MSDNATRYFVEVSIALVGEAVFEQTLREFPATNDPNELRRRHELWKALAQRQPQAGQRLIAILRAKPAQS
jgi:hypothetical protein